MKPEWDEEKRLINRQRHGIDFADVELAFGSERVIFIDNRFDYNETRVVTIGLLSGRIVTIIYTETNEITRIISARKATKNEQNKYFNGIKNGLGEN